MSLGLKAACAYNFGAKVAQLFGVPLPTIPDSVQTGVANLSKKASAGISVDGDGLQSACELGIVEVQKEGSSSGQNTKVKGQALRDFEKLLQDEDPNRTYAGLRRVITAEADVIFALEESIEANEDLFPGHEAQKQLESEKRALQLQIDQQSSSREPAYHAPPPSAAAAAAQPPAVAAKPPPAPTQATKKGESDASEVAYLREQLAIAQAANLAKTGDGLSGGGGAGGSPFSVQVSSQAGLDSKIQGKDLVGKRVLVEGYSTVGVVKSHEKTSVASSSHSRHTVKFMGGEKVSIVMARAKGGISIGTRYIILK